MLFRSQIREKFNIPIIYLTAYADESTLSKAKVSEPYGYIIKPFKEIDLHTSIEMAIYKHEKEWPVVQCGWIEVLAVGPHEGLNFWIDADTVEDAELLQCLIQRNIQDRLKVDLARDSVVESNSQLMRADDLERHDSVNGMWHFGSNQRSNFVGWSAGLKLIPSILQFVLVKLGPGFHQSELPSRQRTGNQLNGVDPDHGNLVLIVRVKVC